jgi:hypothetical protein
MVLHIPMKSRLSRFSFIFLVLATLASPPSASATIRLIRAWQEIYISTSSHALTRVIAGIPETRNLSHTAPHQSASASQTATLQGSVFSFTGGFTLQTDAAGSFSTADAAILQQFEFDVVGQEEVVRFGRSELAVNNTGYHFVVNLRPVFHDDGGVDTPALNTNEVTLPPGHYSIDITIADLLNCYCDDHASESFANFVSFSNLEIQSGALQSHPIVGAGRLLNGRSLSWFDPPVVTEFLFEMVTNSVFTDVASFPTGFSNGFQIVAEGQTLGNFNLDETVSFETLLGHGVSSFRVRNILPSVDGGDPKAFPIMLKFDTPTASFTMTPVGDPKVEFSRGVSGELTLTFEGILQQSVDLISWNDCPGSLTSPLSISTTNMTSPVFFRARKL